MVYLVQDGNEYWKFTNQKI